MKRMPNHSGERDLAARKKLYLPALVILAVVLSLLVFIGLSTYHNLDRQKQIALQLVQRKGLGMAQGFEESMRLGLSMGWWNAEVRNHLIVRLAESADISYVYLLDRQGAILDQAGIKTKPLSIRELGQRGLDQDSALNIRMRTLADDMEVLELAVPFDPLTFRPIETLAPAMERPSGEREQALSGGFIVLGMDMKPISEAHQADLHHAVIMAIIVVALGSSALFFTFVIQKYYMVNRTLKETQDYTRQVVASLATGLISIDPTGEIQSCNEPALRLLGMPQAEWQGKSLASILDFETTGIGETISSGRSVLEKEIVYSTAAGENRPLAISVSPIDGQGAPARGAVILLRDLSEIKALEYEVRRTEKLAAVGGLAASVAHEIRNPLSSIKGFAQFLHKRSAEGTPEKDYTQTMIHEVDRINVVVNDLLTFARPMTANPEPTDVTELVAHAIRLVQADAEERGIEIESRFAIADPVIRADRNQLTQALLNLLLNAITAIDRSGTITVALENDRRGGWLRLWVEDDGPGIDPELQEKIFEPFFTRREKGTGLGLAIVRNIVDHHHGRLSVVSPPPRRGRGSRFTIELPLPARSRAAFNAGQE